MPCRGSHGGLRYSCALLWLTSELAALFTKLLEATAKVLLSQLQVLLSISGHSVHSFYMFTYLYLYIVYTFFPAWGGYPKSNPRVSRGRHIAKTKAVTKVKGDFPVPCAPLSSTVVRLDRGSYRSTCSSSATLSFSANWRMWCFYQWHC